MAQHRRVKQRPTHRSLIAGGLVIGIVLGGGLVAAAAVPLSSGPPTLTVTIPQVPPKMQPLDLPFPAAGESAAAVPALGVFLSPGPQHAVSIASLTKLMTAYVALRALPLGPDSQGPTITVTEADVATYRTDLALDESCALVVEGEKLTERNLLDGMLVHSANNYATLLARMVAGSTSAMVSEMNDAASLLGLTASSYVDVSGYDPGSKSSARDLLHLTELLMRNATFAAIVKQTSVTLPVAGTLASFTPYIGRPGVVGVKSGETSHAWGCDVMAYDRVVGGHAVQTIVVVLGQGEDTAHPLAVAGDAALLLATATSRRIVGWHIATKGVPVGSIGWPAASVAVLPVATLTVPIFPGVEASTTVVDRPWSANGLAARQHVATVYATSGPTTYLTQLVTAGALTRPSLWQRLR